MLLCIYGFWLWLQYKWATVIKKTTVAIMTELTSLDKLETAKQSFTKSIQGEQQLASLIPGIGIEKILGSALFKDRMVLEVQGNVIAGYAIKDVATWDIKVSRDGTVTIILWAPKVFSVQLTGVTKCATLRIIDQTDIQMENQLRQKAAEIMMQEALSGNILEEAKTNAQTALQDLFLKASIQIKEVIITWTGDVK